MYLLQPLVFFPVEQPSKLTPLASSAQDRGNCQYCLSEKLEIVMQQYLRDCNHYQKVNLPCACSNLCLIYAWIPSSLHFLELQPHFQLCQGVLRMPNFHLGEGTS